MDSTVIYKSAKFVKRLYKIVNDPEVKEIQWSKSGKSFVIPNKEAFMKNALPLISKTKEYAAFVRLLNHYGFTKVPSPSEGWEEYTHSNFVRGGERNLVFITRTKGRQTTRKDELSTYKKENQMMRQNMEYLNNNQYQLSTELLDLKDRVDKQDKTISGLIEVLSRVFEVGIQNHKHKALTGDKSIQNNITQNRIGENLEPENKRRMTKDELEQCMSARGGDSSRLMLMVPSENKSDIKNVLDSKEDDFSLSDFF